VFTAETTKAVRLQSFREVGVTGLEPVTPACRVGATIRPGLQVVDPYPDDRAPVQPKRPMLAEAGNGQEFTICLQIGNDGV
jgi:hypothetical protein